MKNSKNCSIIVLIAAALLLTVACKDDEEKDTFVAVTDITGVANGIVAGTPVTLTGIVYPSDATNNTIEWSIQMAGFTGATISGNTLNATASGTVIVRATITNGATASSDYKKDFLIPVFIAVTDVVGIPEEIEVGEQLTLSGTIVPFDATNKTIVWTVANAGTTDATISENILAATNAGKVTIRATIENGVSEGTNFTKNFDIEVVDNFVAVTDIIDVIEQIIAGTFELEAKVVPEWATLQTIQWSIVNAGTTGATLNNNILNAANAGVVTVSATIANGTDDGIDFTKQFDIEIVTSGTIVVADFDNINTFVAMSNPANGVAVVVDDPKGESGKVLHIYGPDGPDGNGANQSFPEFSFTLPPEVKLGHCLTVKLDMHVNDNKGIWGQGMMMNINGREATYSSPADFGSPNNNWSRGAITLPIANLNLTDDNKEATQITIRVGSRSGGANMYIDNVVIEWDFSQP